jgi:hypothetical protein
MVGAANADMSAVAHARDRPRDHPRDTRAIAPRAPRAITRAIDTRARSPLTALAGERRVAQN